jgi:hypothetical protein
MQWKLARYSAGQTVSELEQSAGLVTLRLVDERVQGLFHHDPEGLRNAWTRKVGPGTWYPTLEVLAIPMSPRSVQFLSLSGQPGTACSG